MTVLAQLLIAFCGVWRMRRQAAPARKEEFRVQPPTPVGTELISVSQEAAR